LGREAQHLRLQVLEIMVQHLQLLAQVLRLFQLPAVVVAVVVHQLLLLVTAVLEEAEAVFHKPEALELLAHHAKDITEVLLQLTWVAQLLLLVAVVQALSVQMEHQV
jgi:hypothetical protein